jgi:hypothetical protein
MNVLEQANYRMKNRQWEDGVKERRVAEFRAALERLDEAEYRASFPDNENRIAQLEHDQAHAGRGNRDDGRGVRLGGRVPAHRGQLTTTAPASLLRSGPLSQPQPYRTTWRYPAACFAAS